MSDSSSSSRRSDPIGELDLRAMHLVLLLAHNQLESAYDLLDSVVAALETLERRVSHAFTSDHAES